MLEKILVASWILLRMKNLKNFKKLFRYVL